MFIQSQTTADPATLRFLPGRPVLETGSATFKDADSALRSPLAAQIFETGTVTSVTLGPDNIDVTRTDDTDWQRLRPLLLGAIMEHFVSGRPVLLDDQDTAPGRDDADAEIVVQIKELIETRVAPGVKQSGGAIAFESYADGIVNLRMEGSAFSLMEPVTNMLRHYVPEVRAVRDHRDAMPKPGLETPAGQAIRQILEERINPSVASHGGHISLVDVQDNVVYIRLEGGCQGCGMADVTLKQGIEVEIRRAVPEISAVLDVTDHADGSNPYYQPGKMGESAV